MDTNNLIAKIKEKELKNLTWAIKHSQDEINAHTAILKGYEEEKRTLEAKSFSGIIAKTEEVVKKLEDLGFTFETTIESVYCASSGGWYKTLQGKYKTTKHEVPILGRVVVNPRKESVLIELNRAIKGSYGDYDGPRMIRVSKGKVMRVTNNILAALMHREER